MRNELELGELAVADLVLDLARLQVALVVVGVGLEVPERAEAPECEAGREGERLQGDDEGVAAEEAEEPRDPGRRDPGVGLVHGRVQVDLVACDPSAARTGPRPSGETVAASIGSEVLMRVTCETQVAAWPTRCESVPSISAWQADVGRRRSGSRGNHLRHVCQLPPGGSWRRNINEPLANFGRRVRTFHGELERPDESLVPVRGDE